MDSAKRRLQLIQSSLTPHVPQTHRVLVLPDDSQVSISHPVGENTTVTRIHIDDQPILDFRPLPISAALVLSAVGTPNELDGNPTPKYSLLELSALDDHGHQAVTIPDFWACVYLLWTLLHAQEHIPIVFSLPPTVTTSTANSTELIDYLLYSGLGRKRLGNSQRVHDTAEANCDDQEIIFLSRGAFWQGAGSGVQWGNARGWLRGSYASHTSTFPLTNSFTRSPLVIAAHPLRPPNPRPGDCIYKRFCAPVGQSIAFHALDLKDEGHVSAFHRWHNDERVNKGWGERGTMEKHIAYMRKVLDDPHILPIMMSWDGELMGYAELTWIKEDHLVAYVPEGAKDYDRGLHLLVGEDKYRGGEYAQAWFRSVTHYLFLADPRTQRIIGEPKHGNAAIMKMSIDGGMHVQTVFDFPHKRSAMTMNLRERYFKEDMLT
ncbi:hypothetical protein BD410DRAFT_840675 [Rickenella mellea]|uniref:Acyltransferase MbtK/IucB-like conserved domain-containing protein n=1 Tax=Rickenella mellea TaxID=50990 RepID=A0A4Y7Q1B5_9AGAM|nr:hypothetical protein BD410DRAFT_840675 [Rickenella mellea]